jgi:cystinosin
MEPLDLILHILGVSYTLIWSLSFYFQAYLIIKLKSAEGYSLDFQIFNLIGFSYLIANNWKYFNQKASFDNILDLIFAVNALLMSIVIFILSFVFPRGKNRGSFSVSLIILVVVLMTGLFYTLNEYHIKGPRDDLLIFMGLTKALMSTTKYLYQIYLNSDRKSTVGFSNANVWMDLTGGALSLAQEILKIAFMRSSSVIANNVNLAKFSLSIVVIFFDLIFFYQIRKYRPQAYLPVKQEPLVDL